MAKKYNPWPYKAYPDPKRMSHPKSEKPPKGSTWKLLEEVKRKKKNGGFYYPNGKPNQ